MSKPTLATVWLDGCSGCHMSFLDMDERLLTIAQQVDLVYSPLLDRKDFPELVDITLVEGAVSSEEDLTKIKKIRAHTNLLVSLGDCAITSNVPGMRNPFGVQTLLNRSYVETVSIPRVPEYGIIPRLLDRVRPVHEVVPVDVYLPGCPPSSDLIFKTLEDLIAGRARQGSEAPRFGA
jgi:NAD-reducing hydrogenase small subunit